MNAAHGMAGNHADESSVALLTGATGTVGAALLERLLADGRRVRCMVRNARQLRAHPRLDAVAGDIEDAAVVDRAVRGCTTVFHVAGVPQQWTADPSIYVRSNVDGTRHVLDAALRHGARRFVYASTQDTLDQTLDPFDETSVNRDPRPSPYEQSKILAQRLVDAAAASGLHTCSLHLVAVFGASPRRIGGINALVHGIATGSVPMLPPGGLPLLYDHDAADAFARAEAMAAPGSRYLVSDRYVAVAELAQRVCRVTGRDMPRSMPLWMAELFAGLGDGVASLTRRPPMLSRVDMRAFTHPGRPSNARIRADLAWKPTDLDEALGETIAAWSERPQS